jgi:hypothetical protein
VAHKNEAWICLVITKKVSGRHKSKINVRLST